MTWVAILRAWGALYWARSDWRCVVDCRPVAAASSPEWGRAYLIATGRAGRVTTAERGFP